MRAFTLQSLFLYLPPALYDYVNAEDKSDKINRGQSRLFNTEWLKVQQFPQGHTYDDRDNNKGKFHGIYYLMIRSISVPARKPTSQKLIIPSI